jgi:hypothetical protein
MTAKEFPSMKIDDRFFSATHIGLLTSTFKKLYVFINQYFNGPKLFRHPDVLPARL